MGPLLRATNTRHLRSIAAKCWVGVPGAYVCSDLARCRHKEPYNPLFFLLCRLGTASQAQLLFVRRNRAAHVIQSAWKAYKARKAAEAKKKKKAEKSKKKK
jgi:hypothetical protein